MTSNLTLRSVCDDNVTSECWRCCTRRSVSTCLVSQYQVILLDNNNMRNNIILIATLLCSVNHAHSQQLTSVRFLSLRNLLDTVTGFFNNLHQRSFKLNVKEKPSYKPNPSYHNKPNVLLNSHTGSTKVKMFSKNTNFRK